MPNSIRYFNQTAPFWDFVADMEGRGNNRKASDNEEEQPQHPAAPWTEGWVGFPWGPFPHRGRRHGPPHHHHGPPPPPGGPPPAEGESETEAGPSEPCGPPPPFSDNEEGAPEGGHPHHGRHGHGSRHGPGGMGARGGRGRCGGRGGWGGRGRGHFHPYAMGGAGPFGGLAELFQSQLFGEDNKNNNKDSEDFKPEVDVFDTTEAFIVHVSLPGAKKEDVGVNWDAEKSELSVAGVVYRPGDEELLKTLALDERKAGAFERKVRLGSRANPAQVDVEGITARLEDGILRVEVPKMEEGFVEVKKVDIE